MKLTVLLLVAVFLFGCAHIEFDSSGKGLTYYDPKPYLFVSTTTECVTTATVVILPGAQKTMTFEPGYGSATLSATLSNGMISTVGQTTDTKIPETITSIATLGTAVGGLAAGFRMDMDEDKAKKPKPNKKVICKPEAKLYPIDSGKPDFNNPLDFPVTKEIVDLGK